MQTFLRRKSLKTEIISILFLSILFITAVLGYISFHFSKIRLISMLGESSRGIASTAANFINAEDLLVIYDNINGIKEKDLALSSPAFSDVYGKMDEAQKTSSNTLDLAVSKYLEYASLLYKVREINHVQGPVNIYMKNGNRLVLIESSDRSIALGTVYPIRKEAEKTINDDSPNSSGIYKDKDGTWISSYAPIALPANSEKQAIFEVNYKIDMYLERLQQELSTIILLCLFGLLGALSLGYQLVDTLASNIKKLDGVASDLDKENYNIKIEIDAQDEIGHLAATFEGLRLSIRKKMDQLRMSLIQEKRAHLESIIALTNAIELRDPYTRQHLYRVDKYAMLIAKTMKLPRNDIEKLRYGCYLHDIGKIYIEDSLLRKVNLLESEMEDIKKHSEKGAKIIEGIPFLKDVVDIILYHQERYDGSGYPKGLKGTTIPLLARIVSVADAFDAMTTDRPYKPKISFQAAVGVIEQMAGIQFDPEVCKAFLLHRDSLEKIAKKHFYI